MNGILNTVLTVVEVVLTGNKFSLDCFRIFLKQGSNGQSFSFTYQYSTVLDINIQGLLKRMSLLIFLFERVISIVMQHNWWENFHIYMTFSNISLKQNNIGFISSVNNCLQNLKIQQ